MYPNLVPYLAVGASLIGAFAVTVAWGQSERDVQSRGLNLPTVSVPAPPPVFHLAMPGLTVRAAGDGSGKVPLPPAAAYPPTCSVRDPQGTPILLAPVPAPDSTFAGWGGDCRGTGPCALKMDRPHIVETRFTKLQPLLLGTQQLVGKVPSPGNAGASNACLTETLRRVQAEIDQLNNKEEL